MFSEILGGNALKDGCGRGGLGGPVGCADAVFIEARHPAVADENDTVGEQLGWLGDVDARLTLAAKPRGLPTRRHAGLHFR